MSDGNAPYIPVYTARTDNLATFTLRTAQFLGFCLNIMDILVTFVLGFGTFLVTDTKCMIQIAGIHLTMLLLGVNKGSNFILAIFLILHLFVV